MDLPAFDALTGAALRAHSRSAAAVAAGYTGGRKDYYDDEQQQYQQQESLENVSRSVRRADGRLPAERRAVSLRLVGEDGSASVVSLGGTRVVASTSLSLRKPRPGKPNEGFFSVSVKPWHTSPGAAGPAGTATSTDHVRDANALGVFLELTLRRSRAVDVEALCVAPMQLVWSVRIEIVVLDDCGNVTDAACLAALASLLHVERPRSEVVGTSIKLIPPQERAATKLSIHHRPLSFTFAFIGASEPGAPTAALLDPNAAEQSIADGFLTVAVNSQREVCSVNKSGGLALSAADLGACIAAACDQAASLDQLLTSELARDALVGARVRGSVGGIHIDAKERLPSSIQVDSDDEEGEAQQRAPASRSSKPVPARFSFGGPRASGVPSTFNSSFAAATVD